MLMLSGLARTLRAVLENASGVTAHVLAPRALFARTVTATSRLQFQQRV